MKSSSIIFALLVSLSACTQNQTGRLTQQEEEAIKKDLMVVIDSMTAAMDRLDAAAGIQAYWDSPDFIAINADGSTSDYQAVKKMGADGAKAIASMKFAKSQVSFKVLARDAAICTWKSAGELVMKSGTRMMYDPDMITFIFRKIDNKWKITYSQESATIVTQKAPTK